MADLIRDCAAVLADTGTFCRFARGSSGQANLQALAKYLNDRLWITQDVEIEIRRKAKTSEFAALTTLTWSPAFPRNDAIPLTDRRMIQQVQDILNHRRQLQPGHFMEDLGEVTTVLLAKERGWPITIDERWGSSFADKKLVPRFSTEELVVEMVVNGAITEKEGLSLFRSVRNKSPAEFAQWLAALRK